jgi:epoxyqueuosine reductase
MIPPGEAAPVAPAPGDGAENPSGDIHAALRAFFDRPDVLDWGVAPARPTPKADRLRAWVDQGFHGSMEYMAKRLAERSDPATFHPWARSAVLFAFPYRVPLGTSRGPYRVAAYAYGGDYHDRARALLREAESALRALPGRADLRFYGFADTAPVFERDLASEAGLGWRGKNACTLSRAHGSAFHLAGFLLDVDLPPSVPVQDFCGGCTRCLDQCPTGAFQGPGVLDATKCISYWTIEAKGEVPAELSQGFGGWVFGCDVCQEVCPWNHKHMRPRESPEPPAAAAVSIGEPEPGPATAGSGTGVGIGSGGGVIPGFPETSDGWISLLRQGGGFQSRYKGTPLTRAGRRSLLRNVAVAARNLGDTSAAGPLAAALEAETEPLIRAEIARTLVALGGSRSTELQDLGRKNDPG